MVSPVDCISSVKGFGDEGLYNLGIWFSAQHIVAQISCHALAKLLFAAEHKRYLLNKRERTACLQNHKSIKY